VASLTSLKAGNPTSVTVTATTTTQLNNGDTLSVTLPPGDTVPSSFGSVTATDNGATVPMSITGVSRSTGSPTVNVVAFTCYASIQTGSTLTFTITHALNRLSTSASQIKVSSSVSTWPTIQAALPALTPSAPLWRVTDLSAKVPVAASTIGAGDLITGPSGTSTSVVALTKSNQLAVLSGTLLAISRMSPTFPSLPKATGKLSTALKATVIGSATVVADVTTTGHLLLATLTNGRWATKDLTILDKEPVSSGAPCIEPMTSGPTTETVVIARSTTSQLFMTVLTPTGDIVRNLSLAAMTGIAPAGPPECAGAPLGALLLAVRGTDRHLKEINLRFGVTPNVLAFTTSDITSLYGLPLLTADPTGIGVDNQAIYVASIVSGTAPGSQNQLVLSVAAIGTYRLWSSVNLTASSSLPAGLSSPIIVATATQTQILAKSTSGGLELITNNGQPGVWNGYDLSAAFGLGTGISSFSASAAGSTTAVTWAAPNGHQHLAHSTASF
jgi:hypothetical protein